MTTCAKCGSTLPCHDVACAQYHQERIREERDHYRERALNAEAKLAEHEQLIAIERVARAYVIASLWNQGPGQSTEVFRAWSALLDALDARSSAPPGEPEPESEPGWEQVPGCGHSAQDWYRKDGKTGCAECDEARKQG